MTQLYERCCQCVDSTFINWERTKLSRQEKRNIEEYEAWGIVRLALYILNNDEYFAFKKYIYEKHGYDPGGVVTGQMEIDEVYAGEMI